jgi:hypothetical protein
MGPGRKALLVTYTMASPGTAVGVFFRALRLSAELRRRGWSCVVVNHGPIPEDPKVDDARRHCEIVRLECTDPDGDFRSALALFRDVDPQVVVFGEYPLEFIEPLFLASRALGKPPLVVVDQLYEPTSGFHKAGIDTLLLYGLRSMWPGRALTHRRFRSVPPFIDDVTARDELPVPAALGALPWITILGLDRHVLRAGVEVLARLRGVAVAGITISHSPDEATRMLEDAGVPPERSLALPLQRDEIFFGLIAGSRAVVLGNGFMQIAEALALGCPAVCVNRGIGLDGAQLDRAFAPLVTFTDDPAERARQVVEWLAKSPFQEDQRAAFARERGGVAVMADRVEEAAARRRRIPRLQRHGAEWWRRLRGFPWSATRPPASTGAGR